MTSHYTRGSVATLHDFGGVNLCQVERKEEVLRWVGTKLGRVLGFDMSMSYQAKIQGPPDTSHGA